VLDGINVPLLGWGAAAGAVGIAPAGAVLISAVPVITIPPPQPHDPAYEFDHDPAYGVDQEPQPQDEQPHEAVE
jgi:hypothetical protein